MLPERLRALLRGSAGGNASLPSAPPPRGRNADKEIVVTRQSRGLEQFFNYIRGQAGLSILDLSGATQQNVNFITSLGHKLYTEDFSRTLAEIFGDSETEQSNPTRIDYFIRQTLDYDEEQFDGVLVWDALEYMAPPLLSATIERLYKITRPKSYLLAFFHNDERQMAVPYYQFRIQDFNTLQVVQHGSHKPAQLFNNRTLEKLFHRFESVKFFLTRENLREVIVKR